MGTLLALSLTTLQSSRAFGVKGGWLLVVCLCGFLFAWLLDLQDTRDLATVKEYSGEASKSLLDVSNVLGSRDVSRAEK